MLDPLEAHQVDVVPQGIGCQGKAVDIVIGISAVLPRPQDHLFLCVILIQIQGLCGSHAVIIEPPGHDQRRNPVGSRPLLPVAHFPEIIVIGMVQPFL